MTKMKIDIADEELLELIEKLEKAQEKYVAAYQGMGGKNTRVLRDSFRLALATYKDEIAHIRARL